MPQTKEGALKARQTILNKYGVNYWKELGSSGGKVKHPETRYFAVHKDIAREAGKRGGQLSRRTK